MAENLLKKGLERYFTTEQLEKIEDVHVGIAGAGGLGSNCAVNLVRSGFKKFSIADFDKVEPSNLNRQFFFADQVGLPKVEALADNLKRINPDIELNILNKRLVAENVNDFFADCPIVVEAFDCAKAKTMLIEALAGSGKLLIAASGLAGWGDADELVTRKFSDNFYLVGDSTSGIESGLPPCAPRVSVASAKQANIILQHVLEK
ncbi:MAG: sulfur carrier protein ThiS adenylyltransferase ThiF [Lentisphaerae bacterium]|nr:sulfur carrier protein ThiS adenylyltransferase ThiF [Lentisphaerota bacterium]MCP4102835.1 sulfur carrier protein ThiS adenylyltransferase ThiF [Lentisphaerota bacterium]